MIHLELARALLLAVLAIGGTLLVGIYATAVLDRVVGRAVARESLRIADAVRTPAREAALLLLQRRGTTERPDAALWAFAPALLGALAAALLVAVPVVPAATRLEIPSGIVYLGAAMALVMVPVFLHGWSANSAFPLIGGFVQELFSRGLDADLIGFDLDLRHSFNIDRHALAGEKVLLRRHIEAHQLERELPRLLDQRPNHGAAPFDHPGAAHAVHDEGLVRPHLPEHRRQQGEDEQEDNDQTDDDEQEA